MKRYITFVVLLAGCAAPQQFTPAADQSGTEQLRAEWDCRRDFQSFVNQSTIANPQVGGLTVYQRNRFMRDCMRAKGYEVVK